MRRIPTMATATATAMARAHPLVASRCPAHPATFWMRLPSAPGVDVRFGSWPIPIRIPAPVM